MQKKVKFFHGLKYFSHFVLHIRNVQLSSLMCAFYLCGTQVIAWVLTPVAQAFQLRYLESQREVGEGTAPRGRVTPLDHGAVEITDLNFVRSHCRGSKGQHRERD